MPAYWQVEAEILRAEQMEADMQAAADRAARASRKSLRLMLSGLCLLFSTFALAVVIQLITR